MKALVAAAAGLCVLVCSVNVYAAAGNISGGPRIYRGMSTIDPDKPALPGVVVVKFKPGVVPSIQELFKVPGPQKQIVTEANPGSMQPLLNIVHARLDKSSAILNNIYIVHYSSTVTPALLAKSLSLNPDLEYAEPHYMYKVSGGDLMPNDSLIAEQYALSKIQAFNAWNITEGDSSVVVGIVDTGVNWMHPDLYANIWHNPNWQSDTSYPGDSIGWDFGGAGNGHGSPTPDNDPREDFPPPYEHGTHVAGIVAAVANNTIGIAGVAPKCRIMPVKVSEADETDPQSGYPYIVYGFEGIIYAADHGARVINCSWGGPGYSQYEQDAVDYAASKGALVVAAAGNDDHSEVFESPAYYNNVLSVAATDQNDLATDFTNVNYDVSVSAPGLAIWSTIGTADTYAQESGTSMASPCAAGVAALVASQHPNYTPQQILEQVRVSSDNIDTLNPGFAYKIGFGRVNAYSALTVSSPGVMLNGVTLSDSAGGNNDGVFTDGETVSVLGTATDWLKPTTNLQLTLTTQDPYVTVVNGNVKVGALQTMGTYNFGNNPLSFKVGAETPAGHIASFVIKISDGSYTDYKGFDVLLNPTFRNLQVNNIATTVTSKGNIGFNDYPNNSQGDGFIYLPDRDSILFEGAFMAGISSSQVVDVARDSTANAAEEDNDFKPVGLVNVQKPGIIADQESVLMFDDSNATSNRVGIMVTLHTYSYHRDSTDNFILLRYRIRNLNTTRINNLHAGLFFDWDIGPNGQNNLAEYDSPYQLGYAYNATRVPRTFAGCALVSGAPVNYMAIDNAASNGIYNGFSKLYKWQALSSGTVYDSAGPSDISMVVAGGPVSIAPAADTVLAFVLAAGDTLQDLEQAVAVARILNSQIVDSGAVPPNLSDLAELYQNFPNPFNPSTTISFALKKQSRVTIDVYDVIGQKVKTLVDGTFPSGGPYTASLSSYGLSSGVYFVRLIASSGNESYTQTRKIMVLK